jgi:hypothetical protein
MARPHHRYVPPQRILVVLAEAGEDGATTAEIGERTGYARNSVNYWLRSRRLSQQVERCDPRRTWNQARGGRGSGFRWRLKASH